jgi:hypothetical protein
MKSFAEECRECGLDPNTTSPHALDCVKLSLDPEHTSTHALACKRLGLDPEKSTLDDSRFVGGFDFADFDDFNL